jgi:hypothetical protein
MTKSPRSPWRRFALAFCVALALIPGAIPATASGVTGPLDTVAAMQPSWNLGNTLDAIPDETSWGNPPVDKALFDTLRSQGFHSVRIPVTWGGHQSTTAPYTIDQAFLDRVRQVVGWALADDRAYGVNATLQASFSPGAPWQIDVITYDPLGLSDASGTADAFAVPTEFHGDRLATMEAEYGDGSNAGPANWTSYQEFNASFSPNYETGTITLTSSFLDSLKDGVPVALTFHFWSGGTATYSVTKSGESITGSRTA